MPRPLRRFLGLLLFLATGCGKPAEPPVWVDLAAGFRGRELAALARALEAEVEPPRESRIAARSSQGREEIWLELPLHEETWRRVPDGWETEVPTGGALLAAERESLVLLRAGKELQRTTKLQVHPGEFSLGEETLRVVLAEGERASELSCRLLLDHGHDSGGTWRAAQRDVTCNGILVFPGAPETLPVRPARGARLGFATVPPEPERASATPPTTVFRVRVGTRVLFEHRQTFQPLLRATRHWVPLDDLDGPCELTFELEGPSPALFANPVLAPAEIGRPGARPWGNTRPDVVVVLCDTFRADNLAAWGGPNDLAPRLNRFVAGSLHFLEARSAAAWTLPSIGTILSGVYPAQHGGTDLDRGVVSEVDTVAEVLSRAGYRTAAVTDGGLFSRLYGQDQGFQWFEESPVQEWSLEATLARARAALEADDGRPLFLVVHTYRVHGPMRTGPDEDLGPGKALRKKVHDRLEAERASGRKVHPMEVALEFIDEGRAIYHDAVRDLDTKLGAWLEELERDGFLARGRIVLTADHGDALGEHEQVGHGSDLYDVKLRVPLALAGTGLDARAVAGPVSLIDLAPTLADLAGVEPARSWVGRSLLGRAPGGPLFAFDFKKKERQLALYAEGKKLMAPDEEALRQGRLSHAFDLTVDPLENQNLAAGAPELRALGEKMAPALEPFLVPASDQPLELTPAQRAALEAIGYGGE